MADAKNKQIRIRLELSVLQNHITIFRKMKTKIQVKGISRGKRILRINYHSVTTSNKSSSFALSYSPPQSRSVVYLLPLLPESLTSERLCQLTDVSEDILCVSKDIVSLKATFTIGLHKILHIGHHFGTL